jgi:hypothetical protein
MVLALGVMVAAFTVPRFGRAFFTFWVFSSFF